VITQLGQLSQEADPVEALAACAAVPAACTNASTVLVNLVKAPPDRRVLDLVSGAMAQGPQSGANPFYASPIAVDVMRLHADADPDAASDLLLQATQALLQDDATARASQGKDGFFAHVIDGLVARVLIFTRVPTPPDLRVRVISLLQALAASTTLPDAAQRARAALGLLGQGPAPTPLPVAPQPVPPLTPPLLLPRPAASSATPSLLPQVNPKVILLLVGGVTVASAIAIAIWRATRAPGYTPRQLRDEDDDLWS
jgi:hypothetical protein